MAAHVGEGATYFIWQVHRQVPSQRGRLKSVLYVWV